MVVRGMERASPAVSFFLLAEGLERESPLLEPEEAEVVPSTFPDPQMQHLEFRSSSFWQRGVALVRVVVERLLSQCFV